MGDRVDLASREMRAGQRFCLVSAKSTQISGLRCVISGIAVTLALFSAVQETRAESLPDWLTQSTMTGDWGGARTALKDAGITVRAFYWDEFAANLSGGKGPGQSNAQQFGLLIDSDMGKLAGIDGGILHFGLSNRWGASDSAYIGNTLLVQSDWGAGQNFRLAQFSYEQFLAGGRVDTQFGFMADYGYSFGFTPLLCDFQNVGFCAHPFVLYKNSGATAYPTGQWGASVKLLPSSAFYAETGIFEVNPSRLLSSNGFNLGWGGTTGALVPVEFGWTAALGPDKLPGHYKIGGYYDTSSVRDVASPNIRDSGRYGAYVLVDQMLFRFESGHDRGLIAFAQGTVSDSGTSLMPYSVNAGIILQGPFAGRPADYLALGAVYEPVNDRMLQAQRTKLLQLGDISDLLLQQDVALQQGEAAIELGYGFAAAPWFMINPNIQYIINPGAFTYTHLKDAWVFGVQTKITF